MCARDTGLPQCCPAFPMLPTQYLGNEYYEKNLEIASQNSTGHEGVDERQIHNPETQVVIPHKNKLLSFTSDEKKHYLVSQFSLKYFKD